MFELAASGVTDGALQNATTRPDLRQLQHDALAEYVDRKRSVKRYKEGQRSGSRPRSAYIHPENSNHTGWWREEGMKKDDPTDWNNLFQYSLFVCPVLSSLTSSSPVSYCHSDTLSLSSASSLLSLQESGTERSFSSEDRRLCSTLPPGADLRSFQSNLFYPGRVTTPRPPVQPQAR